MNLLIKQALLLPLYFFVPVLIAGILTADYSAISQHASEISLTDNVTAITVLNTGAISTGLSCVLLSIGLIRVSKKKNVLSAILLIIFGISMISNGLFPMGNPMHGFYGIGLSMMILPFVSCYELKGSSIDKKYFPITIIAGLVIFIYFWS
ncbi:MAG: putative membrane protein, partial [Sphingobacteriales bacterium]